MSDRDLFRIDQHQLDQEWLRQPDLYHEYAVNLAQTKYETEVAKAKLELVVAELTNHISKFPDTYNLEKTTDPAIKAMVLRQPKYKKALAKYQNAVYRENLAQAVVRTLDHRKSALENLVRLHGQDYFSAPSHGGLRRQKHLFKTKGKTREDYRESDSKEVPEEE